MSMILPTTGDYPGLPQIEHQVGSGYVRHLQGDEAWCGICHPDRYVPQMTPDPEN